LGGAFLDCLSLLSCHGISVILNSHLFNLHNTSSAIGTKNKANDLGNDVVVFLAFTWIREIRAISAGRVMMFHAAYPNLAP
jgi:hypothetical protein